MTNQTHDYTIGMVLEQTLGHVTHSENLQRNVPNDASVRALWALVPWEAQGLSARLPLVRSNWTLRAGIVARQLIRRMQRDAQLDALFIHTQVPAMLLLDKLQQIPSIVSLDATPLQYDALGEFYAHERSAGWVEKQKHRLHQACFHRAHHLVTWSEWTASSLVDDYGVSPDKITVIAPGVNVSEWQRPSPRTAANQTVKILFVGGNFERKGGQDLLAAFRQVRTELQQAATPVTVELHLVTRSAIAAEAGIFIYRDMQPNSDALKALFHQCDIFALPTLGDCLPMVLSEAGAAEMPLVATDVGAVKEIVRDGVTGRLIAPGDVEALADALRQLVLQPETRVQMGKHALRLVRQQFDALHNTYRLLELLKRTIHVHRMSKATKATLVDIQTG